MLYVINTHFYYASVTVHTTHTRTDQTNHNRHFPALSIYAGKRETAYRARDAAIYNIYAYYVRGAAGSPRILERLPAHVSGRGLGKARTRLIGDVKFKDPLSSNVEDIGRRGAFVGRFAATPRPARSRADVFGLAQRGVKGTVAAGGSGNFSPSTGAGYVAYKKPDYSHALSRSDTDLLMLLFETYGGCMERAGGAALPTDAGQGATTWAL